MEREGGDLTGLRRSLLFGVWLPFVAYAFGPWSPGQPGDPKDIELVTHLCEYNTERLLKNRVTRKAGRYVGSFLTNAKTKSRFLTRVSPPLTF